MRRKLTEIFNKGRSIFSHKKVEYLIVTLGLVPILWYIGKGNAVIDGVDTNFPLDPWMWFKRRFFTWQDISNGGSDFSSNIAGLFFHLIQVIPSTLGLNLQQVQIFSLVFWFSLIVGAAFILSRVLFPKKIISQYIFVSLYAFNLYLFNTWENVKVTNLSLMATLPLAITVLAKLWEREISLKKALLYSYIIGVILSGTGINPAYFFTFFLVLCLYFIGDLLSNPSRETIPTTLRSFTMVGIVVLLSNMFWMLPTFRFIFGNIPISGSIDKIGFNNWINSLSENTSLLNVARLQGAWDWYTFDGLTNLPLYIPYALNYFHNPLFILFSFLIPALAISSLFWRLGEKKNLYIAFCLMLALGFFLDAGTHLPTGDLYRWLMVHVPFFTLFRSPWYIFTPLLILAYSGLVGLLFSKLQSTPVVKKYTLGKATFVLLATAIIVGNLIYSYPLITGKIFRPGREDSFYVNFPGYVYQAKSWLDKKEEGRIISYPPDEIEKFKWGYRGIESVLSLLVEQRLLFSPLNDPDSPIAKVIKEFYGTLRKGEIESAKRIAGKLNLSLIFNKHDQETISAPLSARLYGDYQVSSVGEWSFHRFPDKGGSALISSPSELLFGQPYASGAQLMTILGPKEILVNSGDQMISGIPNVSNIAGNVVLAKNSQLSSMMEFSNSVSRLENRLVKRDMTKVEFNLEIPKQGIYQPILERYRLEDFGLDLTKGINIETDGIPATWKVIGVDDSYVYFEPVVFQRGFHEIVLPLAGKNLVYGGDFEGAINFTKGGEGRGKGVYEIIKEDSGKYLSILNIKEADISADFNITNFDPIGAYYIELRYKQIYGNHANVLVTQSTDNVLYKAQVERLPNYPEWHVFSFYYEPVGASSKMRVELLAPFTNDPLGTKVFYDDLAVYRVFPNNLMFIQKGGTVFSSADVKFHKVSPVSYEGEIKNTSGSHLIVLSENYSPQWEFEGFDMEQRPISFEKLHFSANSYANAWYLEGAPQEYRFKIHYRPQKLFWLGGIISASTLVAVILFLIFGNKLAAGDFT